MAIINGTAQNEVLNGTDENDTIRGFRGNDTLFGQGGDDFLSGGPGNDRLDGNRGADRMLGDAGNDLYYVNDERDTVTETQAGRVGGIDRVFASVSFILGDNLEHLTMFGAATLGRGNDLANIIRGNAADNVLQGLRGDDVILGGEGNDRLDGGLGADTLTGGRGDDAYYADSRLDVVIEGRAGGIDTLFTSDSRRLDANVENLTMYGSARNAVGNELDNEIIGNSAANVILGGLGDDTLSGGRGDDNLRGGDGNDVISGGLAEYPFIDLEVVMENNIEYEDDGQDVIDGGDGTDTVLYADLNYETTPFTSENLNLNYLVNLETGTVFSREFNTSSDILISIENVTVGSGDDIVYGDSAANEIRVGDGRNQVFAGDGVDIIYGGRNIPIGDSGEGPEIIEVLRGEGGNDTIISGGSTKYDDNFPSYIEYKSIDILIGGEGDDRLVGGAGFFTMVGGEGADVFEFYDFVGFEGRGGGFYDGGSISHITDFNAVFGDEIIIRRSELSLQTEEVFVGETADVGIGELGYERITRGDVTSTIVRHGFQAAFWNEEILYSTIILDNYAGPISESDFLIV